MTRRLLCAAAIITIWLCVFGWVAGVRWNTPLFPREQMDLAASKFQVVMGAGVEDEHALRVGSVGDRGNALQSIRMPNIQASRFATLRYRFEGFPHTLELSLVFRRADDPGDVQVQTIPWPGHGWTSIDLRKVPDWHGRITELGFAEYATPQVAPESDAFHPFRFDKAELWSPSWLGGLSALVSSWFGYTPWALISISALGPQREVAQAPPLIPLLVLATVLSLLVCAWALRWRMIVFKRHAIIVALILWGLLDLRWLDEFHAKHRLTEDIFAGKSWPQRQQLVADQNLVFAAEQLGYWLVSQPPLQPILVAADAKYTLLRMIYLLLPHNLALLQSVESGPLPGGSLILLYDSTQFHYDAERGAVVGNGRVFPAEPVFDTGGAYVYRLKAGK